MYQNEIATLKETEVTERKEWERKSRSRLDEEWKLQEDGLRERFRKERDAELDRVVQKLEAEVITGRKTMESEFSERMRYNLLPTYILGLTPCNLSCFEFKFDDTRLSS